VKQALLGIAKAWVKLAAQADAYEASEPQAPERVDLQLIDFLSVSDAPIFFKMVDFRRVNHRQGCWSGIRRLQEAHG
jgi:hypothetical protein